MEKEETNKMGVAPIWSLLLKMALPMIFSMVMSALYNIVDSIFIGMMEAPKNSLAITALGYAFPLQMLLVAVAIGTGIGVNAVLSKALGEKQKEVVSKTAAMGYLSMSVFYIVFLIVGLLMFFSSFYFKWVSGNEEVVYMGSRYLGLCFIFSFGQLLQLVSERTLCATGKTHLAMIMQLSGAIANIALDPLFILVWKMGVEGAAIATIIGQMVSMFVGFALNIRCNKEISLSLSFKTFKPDFKIIGSIFKVGFPAIILQTLQSLQTLVLQIVFVSLFNSNPELIDTLVAVYGIYFKLQNFIFMAFYGLVNSMLPIIGYNYGTGNEKRSRQAAFYGYMYGLFIALLGVIIFESMPEILLTLFNLPSAWLSIGTNLTRIVVPSFFLASVCIVSSGVLQGLGNGIHPLIIALLRLLIILFPATYLFGYFLGVSNLWWGSYAAEFVGCVYSLVFVYLIWKKSFKKVA
ncbi:MAG TPA: MATE family efflux transporter [Firmicutes bacterium]|nr:MATE family efflux transporter [Bacillota bacterium]HBX24847.1 MATE family efflux transporter [Bacillota bacterium]